MITRSEFMNRKAEIERLMGESKREEMEKNKQLRVSFDEWVEEERRKLRTRIKEKEADMKIAIQDLHNSYRETRMRLWNEEEELLIQWRSQNSPEKKCEQCPLLQEYTEKEVRHD